MGAAKGVSIKQASKWSSQAKFDHSILEQSPMNHNKQAHQFVENLNNVLLNH